MVVKFTSDGSVTADGFRSTFTCGNEVGVMTDACTTGVELTDGGTVDRSGGVYSNKENCRWTLACSSGSPTVMFESFDVETSWDFVNIYDGGDINTATLIAHLDGNDLPQPVPGTGPTMVLQFISDGSVTADGFRANYVCG